jgi:hypothetical protein
MLCLVLLEDRKRKRSYQIMRFLRNKWQFQEGLGMSDQRVVAWAAIDAEVGEPMRAVAQEPESATMGSSSIQG